MRSNISKKLSRKLNYADCIRKYFKSNASMDEIREVAARICRDYLTGQWKYITAEDIIVKRISGGLSNFLYYVSLPEACPGKISEQQTYNNISGSGAAVGHEYDTENSFAKEGCVVQQAADGCGRKRQRSNSGEIIVGAPNSVENTEKLTAPREVLLRIYGQTHGENALEAMITESVVFALLSERNFGPKLHGVFPGGRIEQYIPARPLSTSELSDCKISMKIAEKMGEIHSLNIPMSKEPDWLWNCMDRWLKSIVDILRTSNRSEIGEDLDEVRAFDFLEEGKWLKSVIDSGNFTVFFCHNDLQEGNILYRTTDSTTRDSADVNMRECEPNANSFATTGEIARQGNNNNNNNNGYNSNNSYTTDLDSTRDSVLSNNSEDIEPDLIIIDFEYCAYNYRGFDLANHFLEWTFDYTNPSFPFYFHCLHQYPTEQQRHDFIVSYLKKLNSTTESYTSTQKEITEIDMEVRIFSMFSHLFWSMWSVVNVASNIEFGYWKYAITRIREYKKLKQEYMSTLST